MKKIAIYSTHPFEKPHLLEANKERFKLLFINTALSVATAALSAGCCGIALFTSDDASAKVLELLKEQGIQFIAARSAGYDHIDIKKATELGINVANVPAYSPNAIAEHTVALMLALDRHLLLSDKKVKNNDFSIDELTGFNLQGKTVGIIGTGKIGAVVCKILNGFDCRLIAYDIKEDESLVTKYGLKYVTLEMLCRQSDIITLHTPLNEDTKYIIDAGSISMMKEGVMLINTSRGKLMNTSEVIKALHSGKIGYLGIDVYENEKGIFFHDHSQEGIKDEMLQTLIGPDNVLITSHHAFLTKEALKNIADTTVANIDYFVNEKPNPNLLNIE